MRRSLARAATLRHQAVLSLKCLFYGRRGEPYRMGTRTVRFVPGTRPIRLRYINSPNGVNRFDALQVRLLSTSIAEGDTAIDVGAHAGTYTLIMAAKCGSTGHVVAFEPDPYARQLLVRNIGLNPSLKRPVVESFACSDVVGEAILYSRGGNAQSSLVRSAVEFSREHRAEELRVPLITLDAYIRERKIAIPRWVKVDAEGAEIRILKGAQRLLETDANILCELHPYAWAEFGNTLVELKAVVAAAGRSIRYLDQHEEMGEEATYGTVILERRS